MVEKLKRFKEFIFNLIYPQNIKCLICEDDLDDDHPWHICSKCRHDIEPNNKKICKKCGQPTDNARGYCFECKSTKWYFKVARAPMLYSGGIVKLIHKFKEKEALYLARPIAKMMCDEIVANNMEFECVTFVPMHKMKKFKRGYNQSELLAKEIAKNFKVPCISKAIVKIKQTKSQAKLNYKERQTNLSSAFECNKPELIKGRSILLVDDIFTTGATTNECAKTLYNAGAKEISVITFAHTTLKNEKNMSKTVDITT